MTPQPLEGVRIVSLAVNLPGPIAAMRLADLGGLVLKVEPPAGDPVAVVSPDWYERLTAGQDVLRIDLKSASGRDQLHVHLADASVLLTSSRPAALARLGLSWESITERHPRLSQVAIVGHAGDQADRPGHDLSYQADAGLVDGPRMPRAPYVDLTGAERAAGAVLAVILGQVRHGRPQFREVVLADIARDLAEPWRLGLTGPDGILGGGFAGYGIYATADGFIALAALEPQFQSRLAQALGIELSREELEHAFSGATSEHWRRWADRHDLPLAILT